MKATQLFERENHEIKSESLASLMEDFTGF